MARATSGRLGSCLPPAASNSGRFGSCYFRPPRQLLPPAAPPRPSRLATSIRHLPGIPLHPSRGGAGTPPTDVGTLTHATGGRGSIHVVYTWWTVSRIRTNIEIEDGDVRIIMERYGLRTKTEAVALALRHLAGQPMTREEALAMRGAHAISDVPGDLGPRGELAPRSRAAIAGHGGA
jgi:Arc/MetJ family transcription regulator